MRGAAFNGRLQRLAAQKTVNESGRKRVAAANAVEYLQVLALRRVK
jgi:hypothetical protein